MGTPLLYQNKNYIQAIDVDNFPRPPYRLTPRLILIRVFRIIGTMNKVKHIIGRFHHLQKETLFFLAFFLLATIMIVFVYAIAQNILRAGANDPQVQMAENAAFLLDHNAPMGPIVPELGVELSRNSEPFIQIYDKKGSVVDGNATLHGKIPHIPKGALDNTKEISENRITWQPERGVRIATVIRRNGGQTPGFVITGRLLNETENRIGSIGKLCLLVWFGMICIFGVFYYFISKKT